MKMPLIWINEREKSMGTFRNIDELTTATRSAFKKGGFYDGLQLVTLEGDKYIVQGAKKEYVINQGRIKTFLWKLIGGELYRVKLDLSDRSEISYSLLLASILQIVEKDEEYWDSDGLLEQFKSKARNSNSIKELVELLDEKYNGEFH
ncbi:MAG TPA: hypothetical protein VJ953_14460 [Saprospiraceae bacterium]|nr:hypothetical protein [Saprospiraceae bacterium]